MTGQEHNATTLYNDVTLASGPSVSTLGMVATMPLYGHSSRSHGILAIAKVIRHLAMPDGLEGLTTPYRTIGTVSHKVR